MKLFLQKFGKFANRDFCYWINIKEEFATRVACRNKSQNPGLSDAKLYRKLS